VRVRCPLLNGQPAPAASAAQRATRSRCCSCRSWTDACGSCAGSARTVGASGIGGRRTRRLTKAPSAEEADYSGEGVYRQPGSPPPERRHEEKRQPRPDDRADPHVCVTAGGDEESKPAPERDGDEPARSPVTHARVLRLSGSQTASMLVLTLVEVRVAYTCVAAAAAWLRRRSGASVSGLRTPPAARTVRTPRCRGDGRMPSHPACRPGASPSSRTAMRARSGDGRRAARTDRARGADST
jgi:hypothetical protein